MRVYSGDQLLLVEREKEREGEQRRMRKEEEEVSYFIFFSFCSRHLSNSTPKKMKKEITTKNLPRVPERRGTDQEVGTGARDEAQSVVAVLRVLPEVRVRVVEDVGAEVGVVE